MATHPPYRLLAAFGASLLLLAGDSLADAPTEEAKPIDEKELVQGAALGLQEPDPPLDDAPRRVAQVISVQGDVRVFSRKELDWEPVKKGRFVLEYEVLGTGPDGHADLLFQRTGRVVRLDKLTFLAIPPLEGEFLPGVDRDTVADRTIVARP